MNDIYIDVYRYLTLLYSIISNAGYVKENEILSKNTDLAKNLL